MTSSAAPPPGPEFALLLDFDGTAYTGDLPYLAYARHVCDHLEPTAAAGLIRQIRSYLETTRPSDRAQLPAGLQRAEDGYQAVAELAVAAGVGVDQRRQAYLRSRQDLAHSAFAVDAAEGLVELLAELGERMYVLLATNAPAVGVAEVLAGTGLAPYVDRVVVDAGKPGGTAGLVRDLVNLLGPGQGPLSGRLVAAGDRWGADLADADRAGGRTAYVDRFHRGDGGPSWRATDLASMLPMIRKWCRL